MRASGKRRDGFGARGLVSPNLLTGLIFCKCSSAMHVLYSGVPPKNKYKYYACTNRVVHKNCTTDYIRADILEKSVLDKVKEFYSDEKLLSFSLNNLKKRFLAELPDPVRNPNRRFGSCLRHLISNGVYIRNSHL